MQKNEIPSRVALIASVLAVILVLSSPSRKSSEQQLQLYMDKKIEVSAQTIRAELSDKLDTIIRSLDLEEPDVAEDEDDLSEAEFRELVAMAKSDPALRGWLQKGIESVLLKHMASELDSVDWIDTLSKENLQKLLTKAANNSMGSQFGHMHTPIDVSDIDSVEGKVDRILEEFDGLNVYSGNNALVKQIIELGDEAIEPLLEHLAASDTGSNFAMRMAVTDSLKKLLTEEHEEIIIAEFTKTGNLSELVEKYQFPAAEDEVMNKISYPKHGRVDRNVVDAALKMNPDKSIPLLMDYVSHGQGVSYAAEQLAAEGVDITDPLRKASGRAENIWEQAQLVELCLERDMTEGYDLAIQVLRSNETHAEHSQEQVYQYIRKYTGINGSYEEVAEWLEANKEY